MVAKTSNEKMNVQPGSMYFDHECFLVGKKNIMSAAIEVPKLINMSPRRRTSTFVFFVSF